jgi:hypothetical protein
MSERAQGSDLERDVAHRSVVARAKYARLPMTLVVARAFGERVRVAADLRVTRRDDTARGYPIAVLKNVVLTPDVLVAFAGDVDVATAALRQAKAVASHVERILEVLVQTCEQAAVEFIVADRPTALWRVSADGIEPTSATWVGDKRAYEVYQRGYHTMPAVREAIRIEGISPAGPAPFSPDELEVLSRMLNGTIALENTGSIASVGEAFVWAHASATRGFQYEQQAMLQADHEQELPPDRWVTADWGTVANGGFGYSMLVPVEPGIGIVGLYFPHAHLGLLYHPLARDEPFVYPRVSHSELREAIRSEHDVELHPAGFGPSAPRP